MFLLLKDGLLLLVRDTRSTYYPAMYVDETGETQRQSRGKPLMLDGKRYGVVRRLWVGHNIAKEVINKRSTSVRVILLGYY